MWEGEVLVSRYVCIHVESLLILLRLSVHEATQEWLSLFS
jgi:hypothetical protein